MPSLINNIYLLILEYQQNSSQPVASVCVYARRIRSETISKLLKIFNFDIFFEKDFRDLSNDVLNLN